MNDRIQLSKKQREHLIKLKSALHIKYSNLDLVEAPIQLTQPLYDNVRFLKKVINNGHYHKSSATKLNKTVREFHYILKEQMEK